MWRRVDRFNSLCRRVSSLQLGLGPAVTAKGMQALPDRVMVSLESPRSSAELVFRGMPRRATMRQSAKVLSGSEVGVVFWRRCSGEGGGGAHCLCDLFYSYLYIATRRLIVSTSWLCSVIFWCPHLRLRTLSYKSFNARTVGRSVRVFRPSNPPPPPGWTICGMDDNLCRDCVASFLPNPPCCAVADIRVSSGVAGQHSEDSSAGAGGGVRRNAYGRADRGGMVWFILQYGESFFFLVACVL